MKKADYVIVLTSFLAILVSVGVFPAEAQGRHRGPGVGVYVEIDAARLYEIWEARERAGHAYSERRSSARMLGRETVPLFHCGAASSLIVTAGRTAVPGQDVYWEAPRTSCRAGEALFAEPDGVAFCAPFQRPGKAVPAGPSEITVGGPDGVVLLGECVDGAGGLTPAHILAGQAVGADCVDEGSSVRFRSRRTAGDCAN